MPTCGSPLIAEWTSALAPGARPHFVQASRTGSCAPLSSLQEPSPLVERRHTARVVLAEEAVAIAGKRAVEEVEHRERDPAEDDGGLEEPRPDFAARGAVGQQALGGGPHLGEQIDAVDVVRVSSVAA